MTKLALTTSRLAILIGMSGAFAVGPLGISFTADGLSLAAPAAVAKGDSSGPGGGGDDGGDHDSGDDDGGDDDDGDDGDDDHSGHGGGDDDDDHDDYDDEDDDDDDGDNHGGRTTGGTASSTPEGGAVKIEISRRGIEVLYANGVKEEVEGGRYELKDTAGRTVVERPATQADVDRLQALR